MLGKRTRPLLCTTSKSSLLFANECTRKVDKEIGKHSFALPSHIDAGFDIGAEVKLSDACESPRSVLDLNVLPSQQKQVTARSLRSCLRRLPLLKKGNQGVGLALIVDIQAEEEEDYGSVSPVDCHVLSASARSHQQQRSQPIAIVGNPWQRDHHSANKDSNYADSSPSHSSQGASSVPSVLDFFGSDVMSPWRDCVVDNQLICGTEIDEDYTIHQSIFSVSSIPSNYCSLNIRSMSFLEACFLCQHAFSPGKDIFMYRGDQAFCSAECRGKQMKTDDYKEKKAVMALPSHRHVLSGLT